jgi:hypothetical protein
MATEDVRVERDNTVAKESIDGVNWLVRLKNSSNWGSNRRE